MARFGSPATPGAGTLAARVLFAVLVAATIGAFFVTTRLKRSAPVVQELTFSRYLSPNGDGRRDFVDIGFRTRKRDEVTVSVVSEGGDDVRFLARDRELPAGRHGFRWDGRLSSGDVAPDGRYRLRVGLRRQGRSVISPRRLFVDTRPPRPVVRFVTPAAISPDGIDAANRARLRFDGPHRRRPTLLVYRTDRAQPRLVAVRTGKRGSAELSWDGRVGPAGRRRPAPSGNYLLVASVQDAAGNRGPVDLPPSRGRLEGHPGVVVRYLAATGPLAPVRAGDRVRLSVLADGRRYRWRLRRLGTRRVLERGTSRASELQLRAPGGRSGVVVVELDMARHRYEVAFAVQGAKRRRVLVVLPAVGWAARNRLDADGDGFADLLPEQKTVLLRRPFTGDGLPPGFGAREAPALLFLDRARRRYDLTTDLALVLASDGRPALPRSLGRYGGVLFAAAPRFYSPAVGALVRRYVRGGGRVAWLGSGGFRLPVEVGRSRVRALRESDLPQNALSERLRADRASGLLTVLGDRISFFRGVGGSFGPFPTLEQSAGLPQRARPLASAGHESGRQSIVVYRWGRGVVARVGAEGLARRALHSQDAARIMRSTWALLSR